jgi:hypothetical protein
MWRRFPVMKRRAPLPVIALSWFVDKMISWWLPPSNIFHGLSGVCFASIHKARRLGAITLIENGTLHPVAWQCEVLADCASGGLRATDCERVIPLMQIRRREREYEMCDKIIVYSSAAERSFRPFPYANKVVWCIRASIIGSSSPHLLHDANVLFGSVTWDESRPQRACIIW